jgi:hypothetical protein
MRRRLDHSGGDYSPFSDMEIGHETGYKMRPWATFFFERRGGRGVVDVMAMESLCSREGDVGRR